MGFKSAARPVIDIMAGHRAAVALLSLLLIVGLVGANLAIAADRGPLNAEHVKSQAEEEGLYAAVQGEVAAEVEAEVPQPEALPFEVDTVGIVTDALSPAYLQNQTEANIDRVFDFLNERSDLVIEVDIAPLKTSIATEIEEVILGIEPSDLDIPYLGPMTENQSSYETLKEEELPVPPEELSDEQRAALQEEFGDELDAAIAQLGVPGPFEDHFGEIADLVVEAMTTTMPYETFDSQFETIHEDMADEGSTYLLEEYQGGVPDTFTFDDEIDESQLSLAQTIVSMSGTVALGLAVAALALIGLIFLTTRSIAGTALPVGISSLIAGGVSLIAAVIAPGIARDFVEIEDMPEVTEALRGIVGGMFDPLFIQSAVLAIVGVGLIVVAFVVARDIGSSEDEAD